MFANIKNFGKMIRERRRKNILAVAEIRSIRKKVFDGGVKEPHSINTFFLKLTLWDCFSLPQVKSGLKGTI